MRVCVSMRPQARMLDGSTGRTRTRCCWADRRGSVRSSEAAAVGRSCWPRLPTVWPSPPARLRPSRLVLQLLPGAVQAQGGLDASAVRSIQRVAAAKAAGTPCAGMASTLAALELTPGGARIVSVGDSRIYRLREGCLQQLTVDHTIGRRLVAAGELSPEQFEQAGSLYDDLDSTLVALEAEAEFDIHSCVSDLQEGDVWLCCTDGVTQALPDPDLALLLTRTPPGTAVRAILDVARTNRESDDNLCAIVSIVRVRDAQLP